MFNPVKDNQSEVLDDSRYGFSNESNSERDYRDDAASEKASWNPRDTSVYEQKIAEISG